MGRGKWCDASGRGVWRPVPTRVLPKLETAKTQCHQPLTPAETISRGPTAPPRGGSREAPKIHPPHLTKGPPPCSPADIPSPWQPLCYLLPFSAGTARPHGSVALSSGFWAGPKNSVCTRTHHTRIHTRAHTYTQTRTQLQAFLFTVNPGCPGLLFPASLSAQVPPWSSDDTEKRKWAGGGRGRKWGEHECLLCPGGSTMKRAGLELH